MGTGLFQFFFAAAPSFSNLGVNIHNAAHSAQDDPLWGPVISAVASNSRTEHVSNLCFGIVLGYTAYMYPYEYKGPVHLAVALWSFLMSFNYHQLLQDAHPWGPLALAPAARSYASLMRLVLAAFSLIFWTLSVLSFTLYYLAVRNLANNSSGAKKTE